MSKFCGNCGTQLDDSAKICGNCGTPLDTNRASNSSIPGVNYGDPEKKAKMTKNIKMYGGIAALILVVIIAIKLISGSVGYKGTVRKFMKAYEDYDIDTIVSMSSDIFSYMGMDDYAEYFFKATISSDLEAFEDKVGRKYDLSYEIVDSYELEGYRLDDLMEELESYDDFDPDDLSEIMMVELLITAEDDGKSMEREMALTLTKEDGDWKIFGID